MDIFAVEKGKANIIEIDKYEELTKKRFPYYQYRSDKRLLHYAVCPECGNPIQIVNLFGSEMMQNKTNIVKTHAKHSRTRINGFSFWNENDKENCNLYNPCPLGNTTIKHNDIYSKELYDLIEKNKREIFKNIREITNINLSNAIINHLYEVFMNSEAYGYKAVTKYNIPYAMLYYQQSISLYGQYVMNDDLGKIIKSDINNKSKFFEVKETGEIVKKVTGYRTINLILTHFKKNSLGQTVVIEIYESLDDNHFYTLFKRKIDLNTYIYCQ